MPAVGFEVKEREYVEGVGWGNQEWLGSSGGQNPQDCWKIRGLVCQIPNVALQWDLWFDNWIRFAYF